KRAKSEIYTWISHKRIGIYTLIRSKKIRRGLICFLRERRNGRLLGWGRRMDGKQLLQKVQKAISRFFRQSPPPRFCRPPVSRPLFDGNTARRMRKFRVLIQGGKRGSE
ncbi:unnamed protein product, partial [Musa acuminata var. zebrina]